ncbi:vitamin B12 transport system permease protein [Pseudoalteromonas ulvae UL12]|uniref:FecCD family ABC transporter permease n=1 Tax=Pseudoalteromonas ulvae TaxID=107327 RepID=UPI0019E63294|nr:iron ABC transporter permease [Pseudoalteromonas ulvae]MBE0366230.1 vitamin B12 transport system permease protein [Pseudoalteromonas ulvae UL12]
MQNTAIYSLTFLFCLTLYLAAFNGGLHIPTISIFEMSELEKTIVLELRLPKIITAILVGISLSIAGHLYQLLLSNPLAEPSLLGVSSLCSLFIILGAAVFTYYNFKYDVFFLFLFGCIGSAFALFSVFKIAKRLGNYSGSSLILSGICITTMASAVISWIIYYSNNEQLRQFSMWMLGSFEHVNYSLLCLVGIFVVLITTYIVSKRHHLDLIYLGDKNARLYGLNTLKCRRNNLILASILTACAVTLGGMITFIGLLVPHATRLIFGHSNKRLVPLLIVNGAMIMLLIEWLSRTLTIYQLPISLITTCIGGPIFLGVLFSNFKNRAGYA